MVKTYKCPHCGEFDHECTLEDKELKECPKCHSKVTRVFKPFHYDFKTDGFAGRGFA